MIPPLHLIPNSAKIIMKEPCEYFCIKVNCHRVLSMFIFFQAFLFYYYFILYLNVNSQSIKYYSILKKILSKEVFFHIGTQGLLLSNSGNFPTNIYNQDVIISGYVS